MTRLAVLTVLGLSLLASTACASSREARCGGTQLAGTFTVLRGSAGAGHISYRLALKNVSSAECTLTGLPRGRLLSKTGKPLPTHVVAAFPGALTAILVRLAPGATAHADARFSPDVPGVGEPTAGLQCEQTSRWFRVTAPGGGTTKVRLAPATPVCEHGRLSFTAYGTK
jgi:hypothetical protein